MVPAGPTSICKLRVNPLLSGPSPSGVVKERYKGHVVHGPAYQAGAALFRTTLPINFNPANRLDAVDSQGEPSPLYREGAGLPTLNQLPLNYSWYRDLSVSGWPQDGFA